MSQTKFQVAYDGEGILDGSIDVRVLAPALLSLGELINEANEALNGDAAVVSLRVESDFRTGSFEISLLLNHSVIETVKTLLTSHPILDAGALFAAVFGVATNKPELVEGLLKLYKMLRGEKPKTTLVDQGGTTVVFVMGDGNNVRVEGKTASLYANEQIIRQIEKVVDPLANKQVDSLEVRKEKEVVDRIERADLPERLLLQSNDDLSSTNVEPPAREVLLRVTKPNFEGGRWSFSDGASKFGAEIVDESFNEKVKRRQEGFFAGDTLRVKMRTSQRIGKGNKLDATHTIEKVLEHMHAPRDQALPFGSETEVPRSKENE